MIEAFMFAVGWWAFCLLISWAADVLKRHIEYQLEKHRYDDWQWQKDLSRAREFGHDYPIPQWRGAVQREHRMRRRS